MACRAHFRPPRVSWEIYSGASHDGWKVRWLESPLCLRPLVTGVMLPTSMKLSHQHLGFTEVPTYPSKVTHSPQLRQHNNSILFQLSGFSEVMHSEFMSIIHPTPFLQEITFSHGSSHSRGSECHYRQPLQISSNGLRVNTGHQLISGDSEPRFPSTSSFI